MVFAFPSWSLGRREGDVSGKKKKPFGERLFVFRKY